MLFWMDFVTCARMCMPHDPLLSSLRVMCCRPSWKEWITASLSIWILIQKNHHRYARCTHFLSRQADHADSSPGRAHWRHVGLGICWAMALLTSSLGWLAVLGAAAGCFCCRQRVRAAFRGVGTGWVGDRLGRRKGGAVQVKGQGCEGLKNML